MSATRALAELARKLVSLRADQRALMLQAAALLPAVRLVQRALPFKRWRPLLTRPSPAPHKTLTPGEIALAVDRARRGVPGVYKCLPVAYTGHLLLHRHGHASTVQVGVARDAEGKVEAHAWVECDGQVLIGELPDLSRFVPFPALRV
ncbi:MAG TPA: lasso peptide biosynthesis B2 protein [Polyangiales bacterium]|nr:lasso peptide biosynthesis B2 protein [Polyangiales bacterium]